MSHTSAPWTFDECGGTFYIFGPEQAMVADNHNEDGFVPPEVVARMRGTGRGATDEEKQANARLIAAAPELLEACKAQHDAIDILFAMLIEARSDFYPSQSGKPWTAALQGNRAIEKAESAE